MNIKYAFLLLFVLNASILAFSQTKNIENIKILYDYDLGLEKSRESDKPIFLLFTGNSCENNNKMHETLKQEKVQKELEKYVQIHLYVDDSTELEKPYPANFNGIDAKIKTVGNKWGHLQMTKYNSNLQPLYLVIDSEEKIVDGPYEYTIKTYFGLDLFLQECAIVYNLKRY